MRMKRICLFIFAGLLFTITSFSQVTVTNPTNTTPNLAATYTSLANAITALDAITAISGPVIITLNAGNPETAPASGYSIQFAATTTAANTVTISGSNNTITASAALTAGRLYDGIFKIIGADYITIQNFTMQENPANTITASGTNNMTEWGVAMLHSSVTDGAQHNTIQNNTISLNRTYQNTFGIYSNGRHAATTVTTTENITNVTGSNFANRVYGNTISNVGYGIVFVGSSTPAFMDDGNDIGGSSAATGNTITNWGEGSIAISGYVSVTTSSFCIYVNHQINENVSYNTITSATVTGATFTFGGILKAYSTTSFSGGTITSTINNNMITLSSTNASGTMDGILNQNLTALSTATFNISNNQIVNCSISAGVTSSAFGGIIHSSAPGVLNITNNTIRGLTSTSTTGGYTGISNSGAVVTTINITNNKLGDAVSGAATFSNAFVNQVNWITNTGGASTATVNINNNSLDGMSLVTSGQTTFIQNQASSAVAININNNQLGSTTGSLISFSGAQASAMFFIYNGGTSATCALSITGNDFRGITQTVAGSGQQQYIRSNGAVLTTTISNNTWTNITANTTSNVYLIMDIPNKAAGATSVISSNSVVTGFNKSAAGGTLFFLECVGSSVNGSTSAITNNNFSNLTVTGATNVYAVAEWDGVSSASGVAATITGNIISNITGGSGDIYGIYADFAAAVTCTGNTVSNLSGTGNIFAYVHDVNNGQGTFNYSTNTASTLTSTGTGGSVYGFYCASSAAVPTLNIYSNNFTGLSTSGASSAASGVLIFSGPTTANIYGNTINNVTVSGVTSPVAAGIYVFAGTTLNIHSNKINTIQASGTISTTSPAVNGILLNGGTTVNMYNNFIADLTVTNASLVDGIRGISVTSTTASTTYNLYYNSIYMNATSGGANFGTSGIYHTTSATATTAALNMIDNIIVNTSTANGTGVTTAYRRSDATLTNFAATSDYNLLYAGTPSASRLIYYDGTNSDQTITAYQTRVSTRDANSISLMPTFTSATDLHLTPANCRIDGRGIPVGTVTFDIDLAARNATNPDIGAHEFTGTSSLTLAGVVGSAVCEDRIIPVSGAIYTNNACNPIARITPSGAAPVAGSVNVCVTLDATQQYFNGEPYVQRHFDIEPVTSNQTTTSATVILYFTNQEFVDYNTNNPAWPKMPTSLLGNADPNRFNVKVTQFHGVASTSPSSPGNYPGVRVLPTITNVFWNGAYWEVTFNVTGFSGFYVHTNNFNAPLPIVVNYLTGRRQGSNHLLNWRVTCATSPRATMTLERSSDSRNYSGLYTITADAARCQQPFDYIDASPLKGMNYYRLKIVDADGHVTYSTTVALLNAAKGFDIISIAPNPVVTDNFKLNVASAVAGKLEIVIFDMQGRLVNKPTVSLIAGFNSLPINVANLSPGTYTIKGSMIDDQTKVIRFVKQ
jgi:hypothetical protein